MRLQEEKELKKEVKKRSKRTRYNFFGGRSRQRVYLAIAPNETILAQSVCVWEDFVTARNPRETGDQATGPGVRLRAKTFLKRISAAGTKRKQRVRTNLSSG